MGIPSDMAALARSGVLSPQGMARAGLDLVLPRTPRGSDVSVAGFIGARLGPEVVDRLVEPLLGGVYAGRAEDLSLDSTLPQLVSATRTHRSLISAVRAMRAAAPKNPRPMFATLTGGLGSMPPALAERLGADGATVRTEAMVRELAEHPSGGWRLTIGSAADPEHLDVDGAVLAVPARPAARLLAGLVPAAARELDRIEYAGMALVTLVYAASAFPKRPQGSGYLVPASAGRTVKAVTFSSIKWPHLTERAPDMIVVRCSIGRAGDQQSLQRPDQDLKAMAMAELAETCHTVELPVETRVTRWGGGLPQYNVGHADRVARIRSAVAARPGLAVAGAAYDGIGIPACIASARSAATRLLDGLTGRAEPGEPRPQRSPGRAAGGGTTK
jgi:oxygen-dependent protoporphyrinogen oxidase